MKTSFFSLKTLYWLIIINIAATILHYGHNVMHFEHYPEPVWLNAHLVDMFWFVMTPFALVGGWLYAKSHYWSGFAVLMVYVAMSLLVLGHYNYAPFFEISFIIHVFIWLEVVVSLVLAVYLVWVNFAKIDLAGSWER